MEPTDRDRLAELRAAGFPLDGLTQEQLGVLAALSEHELRVLAEVQQRLDAVAPDVVAHQMVGGLFF
jgi:hypothetical protein